MTYSQSLQGLQLWPSMLFFRIWSDYQEHRGSLCDAILERSAGQTRLIESEIAVGTKPAEGLYESHFDFFSLALPGLENLVRFIETSLRQAVSVAHSTSEPWESYRVRFIDSWYHVTTKGGFHDAHWHFGCSWCGIFYLDVGDYEKTSSSAPSGGSRFYCPIGQGGAYRDSGNRYLHPYFDPEIENGLLLIFPSHLLHSGLPYHGQRERIVIAFNAQVHRDAAL